MVGFFPVRAAPDGFAGSGGGGFAGPVSFSFAPPRRKGRRETGAPFVAAGQTRRKQVRQTHHHRSRQTRRGRPVQERNPPCPTIRPPSALPSTPRTALSR